MNLQRVYCTIGAFKILSLDDLSSVRDAYKTHGKIEPGAPGFKSLRNLNVVKDNGEPQHVEEFEHSLEWVCDRLIK